MCVQEMIIENTLFALYLTNDGNKKKGFNHESKMNGGKTKLNEDKLLSSKNSHPSGRRNNQEDASQPSRRKRRGILTHVQEKSVARLHVLFGKGRLMATEAA